MDPSSELYITASEPETPQVSDPVVTREKESDSPRKPEKTRVLEPPKDGKREAPPAVECTISSNERMEECTRERLKKHRQEMAGQVWIPDIWGQEGFLKEWKDCNVFDRSLVQKGLVSARDALKEECRRTANSNRPIRVQKSC